MSSSSSDDDSTSDVQGAVMASQIVDVPTQTFNTSLARNAGMTNVPQTYTAQGKPAWMTGAWDMPEWGKSAATGQQLEQVAAPANRVGTSYDAAYAPAATTPATENQNQSLLSFYEPNTPLGSDGTQWTGDRLSMKNLGKNWITARSGGG